MTLKRPSYGSRPATVYDFVADHLVVFLIDHQMTACNDRNITLLDVVGLVTDQRRVLRVTHPRLGQLAIHRVTTTVYIVAYSFPHQEESGRVDCPEPGLSADLQVRIMAAYMGYTPDLYAAMSRDTFIAIAPWAAALFDVRDLFGRPDQAE